MDFTLNGNVAARQTLETNPCGGCAPGLWTVQGKNFGMLDG